ncbi:hypothetical protein CPB85DRAFT_1433458 [Mucidula mucida]|nr:hypothetical protein CPB85DRAFT_1433458 [Mucidula mucida]
MSSPPPASSPPAHTSAQSSIPASSPSPFLEDDMFEHDNSDMPHMANVGSSDNKDDDSDDSDSDDESDDEIDSHVTDAVPEGSGKEVVEGALTGRTSVQPSAPLPTYGLFKFQLTSLWTTVPKEVWHKQVKDTTELSKVEREKLMVENQVREQKKKERERDMANVRQQKVRDKKRKAKVESGWEPCQGNFKKKRPNTLKDYDAASDDDLNINVAETSRPHRQFRENRRQSKKVAGRTRQPSKKDAIRINWAQPALFRQIDTAARKTCRPWSPLAIVQQVQRDNPKDFAQLTPQVVGKWICPIAKSQGKSK